MTSVNGPSIPVTAEVLADMQTGVTDWLMTEWQEAALDRAATLSGHPERRRHGPPQPKQVWMVGDATYLDDMNPDDLYAEAKRLHAALAEIAGTGDGADDYYEGHLVTTACEAIGRQVTVPGGWKRG